MLNFVVGVITMGYIVAGLFFAKFWRRSRDPLFAIFAVAFWLLALNQAIVAVLDVSREEQSWAYLLRLAAFILIIVAIVYKNAAGRSGSR
jgi:O-antigen/teichoic acid export membrane protein